MGLGASLHPLGVVILAIAGLVLVLQLAFGMVVLCRWMAAPDKVPRRFMLLMVAILLASIGICRSHVFPTSFLFGFYTGGYEVNFPIYILSMFIGLLFSAELILTRKHLLRFVGMLGLIFMIINCAPGVTEFVYHQKTGNYYQHVSQAAPAAERIPIG